MPPLRPEPAKVLNAAQHRYLLGALFLTGASTLILEIVGTRVISPYYGSSLYCWSALITVTLVALAAGYSLGGRLSDAAASLTLFSRLCCGGAAAVAAVPILRIPVLKATSPLGIQLGALASATILVAPALIFLSALGPLSVRLTTSAAGQAGKSAGDVYAVSTLGSVVGAVLAGFVLIPRLPITQILYLLALLLLLLGAAGLYLSRLKIPVKELAFAAAAAVLAFRPRPAEETNILLNIESQYGQIKVMDFGSRRYLLVNGTSQAIARREDQESDSPYAHSLELAALLKPGAKRALIVGIGAGLFTGALERNYGVEADTIEIDPEMVRAAADFFGFSPRGRVLVGDGRVEVERAGGGYGLAFLDAFGGETQPHHLYTAEAFTAMRRALEPGGVLAVNSISLVTAPGDEAWLAIYKTLRSVFPEVRAFLGSQPYRGLANVLFFCSEAPLDAAGAARRARTFIVNDLSYTLSHELTPDQKSLDRAPLLTDDYAPMESLLARTSLLWRQSLQENLESVLLY